MNVVRIDVESNAQYSGLRDLRPVFAEPPPPLWIHLFTEDCRQNPALTYPGAGHFECRPEEVSDTEEAIRRQVESTDASYETMRHRMQMKLEPELMQAVESLHRAVPAFSGDGYYVW